jgi:hypothetical protein
MRNLIKTDTTYVGTEHAHLRDRLVRIFHVLRDNGHGIPVLLTTDEEFGGGAEGIVASDRVDVALVNEHGGAAFRAFDVPATDLECFVKRCAKCNAALPADGVQLAAGIDERCHDCADYCDDPNCKRCAPRSELVDDE